MPLPFLVPLAAKMLPIRSFFTSIPRPVWIVLGIALIVLMGALWHGKQVKAYYAKAYAAGKVDEAARIEVKVKKLTAEAIAVTEKLRSRNSEENRRISGDADRLRMSGPGKAACISPAAPGASGRVAPATEGSPAVDPVPGGEGQQLIGLPFAGTVALAENHDLCVAEAKAWREQNLQLVEQWNAANR